MVTNFEQTKWKHFKPKKDKLRLSKSPAEFGQQLPIVFFEIQKVLDLACSEQSNRLSRMQLPQNYHKRFVYQLVRHAFKHESSCKLISYSTDALKSKGVATRRYRNTDRTYNAIRRCLMLAEIDHPDFGAVNHSRTASELFEAYKRETPHQYLIGDIFQYSRYVGPLIDEYAEAQSRSETGKPSEKKKRKKKRKSRIADKSKDDDWD